MNNIAEILKRRSPAFSFEFFPPKTEKGDLDLVQAVERLQDLAPDFVSVTYGAGGSTKDKTLESSTVLQNKFGIPGMAHLTCVGHSQKEIHELLMRLDAAGIHNVLALRGDPPVGETGFVKPADGFGFASELTAYIKKHFPHFCVGAACHPEGHPDSPNREADWTNLLLKVKAGPDFLITQLFFDNRNYFDLKKFLKANGVNIPVIAGIMPVTNVSQIKRFAQLCGAHIPPALLARLEEAEPNPQWLFQMGIEHAILQCRELIVHGVSGIHLYTLNKSPAARMIMLAVEPNKFHF